MNKPKCTENDYIQFLIAAQTVFSSVEASLSHPEGEQAPAHDAYTRLLQRLPADSTALWREVEGCIRREDGMLVIDDTTLDKPYASEQMGLVTRHWSGKAQRVVQGINLITLVWTDRGQANYPVDFRLYDKVGDQLNKNEHFRAMVQQAHARGFTPHLVSFDSWYSSLENLKLVRDCGWEWLTRLKHNRQVSLSPGQSCAIEALEIGAEGRLVHLRGYGHIRVFRLVDSHGNTEYWATSRLDLTELQRADAARSAWAVETYHRQLKQFTGVERAQFRLACAQRNHIGLAIRAFIRLEWHRLHTNTSFFEAKVSIVREAIRAYLARPFILLPSTA